MIWNSRLTAILTAFLFLSASSVMAQAAQECHNPQHQRVSASSLFTGLKQVNIYIDIPSRIRSMLDCHGREAQCGAKYKNGEQLSSQLKDDYNSFPKVLYPDNLEKMLAAKVKESILPYVLPGADCSVAPIVYIVRGKTTARVQEKDSLTVTLKLSLDDLNERATPLQNVGVSLHVFRPDAGHSNFTTQVLLAQALPIPLKLSEDEITRRITYLLDHSQLNVIEKGTIVP